MSFGSVVASALGASIPGVSEPTSAGCCNEARKAVVGADGDDFGRLSEGAFNPNTAYRIVSGMVIRGHATEGSHRFDGRTGRMRGIESTKSSTGDLQTLRGLGSPEGLKQMKLNLFLALLTVAWASNATEERVISLRDAQLMLGTSIELLRKDARLSVKEHPDFVDEDPVTVLTQMWDVKWRDGRSLIATTDNGVATRLTVRSSEVRIDKGIKVGDTLAHVKTAFPQSEFSSGSKAILSKELTLYAKEGRISFVFDDKGVWNDLQRGKTYPFDDPYVSSVKLFSISFQNGNQYSCLEQFPCPLFPARYGPSERLVK
ncbi:MAG: hypothetical protein F4229_06565 [Gammaproteobacteria bacterium]|nr:hypothetical protein [Gammaproteobacteria bacterium]